MENILDEYSKHPISKELYESIKWWESRRIYFNILVGISGIIPIILALPYIIKTFSVELYIGTLIGIFVYGFFANMCYCFGWISDVLKAYYYESPTYGDYRILFFSLGLIFSMFITFWFSMGF